MKNRLLFILGLCLFSSGLSHAQHKLSSKMEWKQKAHPTQKVYMSTNMDGLILSSSFLQNASHVDGVFTTPRFTAFLHVGMTANFDFNKNFGIFSGLNIKNIGFIEKFNTNDSTVIRRVYTFGIPVGLKIGNMDYGNYIMLGGGVDFPFNYKEKGFVKRSDKDKFNEWFSNRTPSVMPYVFIGAHLRPGVAFKFQYYPGNFMNTEFVENGIRPYKNYDVNLAMLTIGFDINYYPKQMKMVAQ